VDAFQGFAVGQSRGGGGDIGDQVRAPGRPAGFRSATDPRDLPASDVTASEGRVWSSVLVAQVSLMWILYPFPKPEFRSR
jgi:hypothetical protein